MGRNGRPGLTTRNQTSTLTSYVQHFAAGLIIAAATLDLLPQALHLGGGWPLVIGFVLGTVVPRRQPCELTQETHGAHHELRV